ncbi:unnamed protein product, partial [Rotaria sp. Silwood1]
LLIIFATFLVWITFERKQFETIQTEIGRIIRTNAFPNPTYKTIQIRTRSVRTTTSDYTTSENNGNPSSHMSERKSTGASHKSIRSQKTIATASTDMSRTSNDSSISGTKRQPFQRLLTQRSPVVVTLLPTARDQSAWLFSRRHGKNDAPPKNPKMIPDNEFQIRYEVGVLGQPMDALTLIVSGDTPTGNTSASQLSHIDMNRRSSGTDSDSHFFLAQLNSTMGNKSSSKIDPTILTPKAIQMLKANTNFTEEQIREWHAGFLRDCPNGHLSKDRFVTVYEQFYPGGKAKDFCKYAFATFDRDNNGTIDFTEFMLAIALTQSGDLDERLALAFDMYDYNNTGTIDTSEMAKVISAMYDLTGETDRKGDRDPKHRAEEIIRICDVTGNKKLTKEEFIAGCKNDPVIRRLLVPNA